MKKYCKTCRNDTQTHTVFTSWCLVWVEGVFLPSFRAISLSSNLNSTNFLSPTLPTDLAFSWILLMTKV